MVGSNLTSDALNWARRYRYLGSCERPLEEGKGEVRAGTGMGVTCDMKCTYTPSNSHQ